MIGDATSRDALLLRRADLALELSSNGNVLIFLDGREVEAGQYALAVLDAFGEPRSISDVVQRLGLAGAHDFAALTRTILKLKAEGVLTPPGAALSESLGWAASTFHAQMLNDRARTEAFIGALREIVQPEDVVVDIGTGTGVLAIAAAKAGARSIYAIEASAIGGVAAEMFVQNGVADRVKLVRGWSTHVSLPEKATVMVSETIGNDALGEGIVETVLDARRRHLVPGARLVPRRIRVLAIPCTLPDDVRRSHLFTTENVKRWERDYAMRFDALADAPERAFALMLAPPDVRAFRPLAPPVLLADLALSEIEPVLSRTARFTATETGRFDAALLYFDLDLSPTHELCTHPDAVKPEHSWRYMVWFHPHAHVLSPGDERQVTYEYRSGAGKLRFG